MTHPSERSGSPPERRRSCLLRLFSARRLGAALLGLLFLLAVPGSANGQQPDAEDLESARGALAAGDLETAEIRFRKLLLAAPDDPHVVVGWATTLDRSGRRAESLAIVERAARRRLRRGEDAEAAELLSAAVAALGDETRLLALLGQARVGARQFLGAEDALRRAEALGARDPNTMLLLAASLWENSRTGEAEAVYRRLLDDQPTLGVAHFQLSRLLAWLGRYAEALNELDRARSLGVDGPDVIAEIARALLGASRTPGSSIAPEAAVEAFEQAVRASPGDYQLHYGLARALAAAGDAAGAQLEMKRFRELYEEHQARTRSSGLLESRLAEARSRLAADQPRSALEALARAPADPEVHRLRALALEALDQLDAAVAELEAAVRAAPERADLRVFLARLRNARG